MSCTSDEGHDGTVLESGENSNVGGTLYSIAWNFNLGDKSLSRQDRAFLSFNTGSLPDSSSLTKDSLRFHSGDFVTVSSRPMRVITYHLP